MQKALLSFAQFPDGRLLAFSQTVGVSMNGNPDFPTPIPAIANVVDAAAAFAESLVPAASGNRAAIAAKNENRQSLLDLLRQLATSVTTTANGNRAMLLTTGFDVSKQKEPVVITKPTNLKVVNGISSGDLDVSVKTVKGARLYVFEYATAEEMAAGNWQSTITSKAKHTFSELTPGTVYYCRVAAVGTKEQKVYSDVVSRMVI